MANPPARLSFSGLGDDIKHKVFSYADREAIFSYRIATGGQENHKPYIFENAFREPFTCWDWHDTDLTCEQDDKRKRRLFYERQRGFKANDGQWSSYPSPRARWKAFKSSLDDVTRPHVKRIAVARWMREEDMEWICEELTGLEALDLSDLETRGSKHVLTHEGGQPRWKDILDIMLRSTPRPSPFDQRQPVHILKRLNWLGLTNDLQTDQGDDAFSTVLSRCEQLDTLSLRASSGYDADYWSHQHRQDAEDIHHRVCVPILRIAKNMPETVKTIELRQYMDFLPFFIEKLHDMRPTVQKVGIDLGAWVQVFPLRRAPKRAGCPIIKDEDIEQNVKKAVKAASYFCKQQHGGDLPTGVDADEGSRESARGHLGLPIDAEVDERAKKVKSQADDEFLDREYRNHKRSFYRDDGGTNIRERNGQKRRTAD
jgi:hypothetical protein